MAGLTIKRGDTLDRVCTFRDDAGNPASLSGVTIASEMVLGAQRVALTVETVSASAGTFRLSLTPTQTAALRVGVWRADIEFTLSDGAVVSTDTFTIQIAQDVTGAAS